jgi:adenylyl- and sulfurtransferase ThiI
MYASLITKAKLLESHFLMEDVPVKDLDIIQVKMRKVFMRIAKKGFDMKRMAAIINGHELAVLIILF